MSDEERMNGYKLLAIRGHLSHSHRLNLTEARWLVEELIAAKRRVANLEGKRSYDEGYDEGYRAAMNR